MTEKDKSTLLLEYYLKKLKLPTMLREYAGAAAVCRKDRSERLCRCLTNSEFQRMPVLSWFEQSLPVPRSEGRSEGEAGGGGKR